MKLQLKELNKVKNSLAKLITAEDIPARAAYRATKFSKKVVAEIDAMEEARVALVKKYGVDDGSGRFNVLPENDKKFQEELDVLFSEEVELPDVKIAVGDLEKVKLAMLDYANLDFLIVETDPTEQSK